MWEDNNPLSYGRRDSTSTDDHDRPSFNDSPYSPQAVMNRASSPTSTDSSATRHDPPDFASHDSRNEPASRDDDEEEVEEDYYGTKRKKGGYSSRIEQMLWENKDLQILITDAGKNTEGGGGNYIVYTIRTGDLEVRRRYSEFASLRTNLALLHPTLIIPPIPEKHSMADYVAAPTRAKEDQGIIEHRRRMLGVFLNRCGRMKQVRNDTVFLRFLDPNASWSEVLHSPPISALPKNPLKAPPIDPSHPSPAHAFLPIPASSAKLKNAPSPPSSPTGHPSAFLTHPQLPASGANMSESELDPYFITYETSTRAYENLLNSAVEKVNRRILNRLASLSQDLSELGARYNAFSLSEPAPTLGPAIEKVGQAVDSTYLATEELAAGLASGFTEPMRESAQFAGVVRGVLKYRMMKRIQEELTRDELAKARFRLDQLERSELEARRIENYLTSTTHGGDQATGQGGLGGSGATEGDAQRRHSESSIPESAAVKSSDSDTASVDSDFPPTHSQPLPPPISTAPIPYSQSASSTPHRKTSSFSNPLTIPITKIFGKLSHAMHGVVDVDPETTRRNNIGKTRESLVQLEAALQVAGRDVEAAGKGVLADLKRFQAEKETDMKKLMINFAKCHIEWARKNLETWEEAKVEVDKVHVM